MTFKRTAAVAFAAAIGITSLAACGSDDDSGSAATGSASEPPSAPA